jgi:predicted small lipoprotein YifL
VKSIRNLLLCGPFKEAVVREFRSPLRVLAVVAVFAAATLLTACGRKGPLDPPPAASVTGEKAAPIGSAATAANPGVDANGKPLAPAGEKKRIPLDVLLN